jgi:hypothetical protein
MKLGAAELGRCRGRWEQPRQRRDALGTGRQGGPGKQDGQVHECRNQWWNPLKWNTGSNLADMGRSAGPQPGTPHCRPQRCSRHHEPALTRMMSSTNSTTQRDVTMCRCCTRRARGDHARSNPAGRPPSLYGYRSWLAAATGTSSDDGWTSTERPRCGPKSAIDGARTNPAGSDRGGSCQLAADAAEAT